MNEWVPCQTRASINHKCKQQHSESTGRNSCSWRSEAFEEKRLFASEGKKGFMIMLWVRSPLSQTGAEMAVLQRKRFDRIRYQECNLTSLVALCVSHHIPISQCIVWIRSLSAGRDRFRLKGFSLIMDWETVITRYLNSKNEKISLNNFRFS